MGPAIPPAPDRSGAFIDIYARELNAGKNEEGEARGEVELFRMDQHLATEQILYDPVKEVVTLPGSVSYEDSQVWLTGQQGHYDFLQESGQFSQIDYGLTSSSAHGRADSIELVEGHTSRLYAMDYTSCPGEEPDWRLYAKELELKHEEGRGEARGAKLIFKGVPVLYAPWFTFPIDDRRKSGFLYPSIGQGSDTGLEFEAGLHAEWRIPLHDPQDHGVDQF
jgi:LPS-assembly protein